MILISFAGFRIFQVFYKDVNFLNTNTSRFDMPCIYTYIKKNNIHSKRTGKSLPAAHVTATGSQGMNLSSFCSYFPHVL